MNLKKSFAICQPFCSDLALLNVPEYHKRKFNLSTSIAEVKLENVKYFCMLLRATWSFRRMSAGATKLRIDQKKKKIVTYHWFNSFCAICGSVMPFGIGDLG